MGLSVMANIVFPMHICAAMINACAWYFLYFLLMFLPAVYEFKSIDIFLQPGMMLLPFSPDDSSGRARRFHIFSLMRMVFFLMCAASNHNAHAHMKTASLTLWSDFGWYRYRKWGMMLVPPLPSWLDNGKQAMNTIDPYHLLNKEQLFEVPEWLNQFYSPTRSLFCLFEVAVALLTMIWGIFMLVLVIKAWRKDHDAQSEEDSNKMLEMVRDMRLALTEEEDSKRIEQLGSIIGPAPAEQRIRPVTQRAVRMDMTFFVLDIATDVKQIHDLYLGKQHFLGGLTTFVFFCSMTAIGKDLVELHKESKTTVRTGIFTEEYLKIWMFEKGFENAFSLLLSAYTSRYAILTFDTFLTNIFNILVSAYSLSVFLHRKLVLTRFPQ